MCSRRVLAEAGFQYFDIYEKSKTDHRQDDKVLLHVTKRKLPGNLAVFNAGDGVESSHVFLNRYDLWTLPKLFNPRTRQPPETRERKENKDGRSNTKCLYDRVKSVCLTRGWTSSPKKATALLFTSNRFDLVFEPVSVVHPTASTQELRHLSVDYIFLLPAQRNSATRTLHLSRRKRKKKNTPSLRRSVIRHRCSTTDLRSSGHAFFLGCKSETRKKLYLLRDMEAITPDEW
ncbi:hypothetical protein B296_00049467 [Ensete ventricosum]|uniref:Uncharacterized protein n=1 Tax=Ensete ventricosum TaxID=4639 RepID=A0A426XHA7_ENSVE|nr:hypothetical protein B296_00049467 [Ensete ventricosum]